MRRSSLSVVVSSALLLLSSGVGLAEEQEKAKTGTSETEAATSSGAEVTAKAKEPAKVPYRGSLFVYENTFSALSLSKSAEMTYNPYYAQSLSFRPRYYLRDDLNLSLRLDLEVELTTSDDTDHSREWIVSDLLLDVSYSPTVLKIPVVDVKVLPNLRLTFPTSIVSRGQSMMLGLGPGFSLAREFSLLKGKWLKSVEVTYGFRATKYFHEYATQQLDSETICSLTNPENASCQHTGDRNRSWRFSNFLEGKVLILEQLAFAVDLFFFNDLVYGLEAESVKVENGPTVELGESNVNHRASAWMIFDLSYDVLKWLSLSAGVSTYYPQLAPDSTYRAPVFNRFTAFYFDVAIPVDAFVAQVQEWTGWGKEKKTGAVASAGKQ